MNIKLLTKIEKSIKKEKEMYKRVAEWLGGGNIDDYFIEEGEENGREEI